MTNEKQIKIDQAASHYAAFMNIILPGWENDPNSEATPHRVAKAFITELFKSKHDDEPLKITSFDNEDKYDGIVLQSNIEVKSMCSHHHQIIQGIAHVAYIPDANGKIIGLSKLNRIVEYFCRMPQVQENLTMQISEEVDRLCEGNHGVAVLVKAKHACCSHRGINHDSDMQTVKLTGAFKDNNETRLEFYQLVEYANKK